MDELQGKVDEFGVKTDALSVKTEDAATRSTKSRQGKRAKQNRLCAKDSEEKQLRVVYTCPQHSDDVLQALIELLASTLREKRGEE